MFQKGYFENSLTIIGSGLNELTTDEFREKVKNAIQNNIENSKEIGAFLKRLFYKQQDDCSILQCPLNFLELQQTT